MKAASLAAHLAALDSPALTGLLQARPDVLVEPVPRDFERLAQRLEGPDSLSAAMMTLHQDAVWVGQAVMLLGRSAKIPRLAELLGASPDDVRSRVDELGAIGLAWVGSDAVVCLPRRLHDHWAADFEAARPVAKIARAVLVDDLRTAVVALGGPTTGLRKPELVASLATLMSDPRRIAQIVAALPAAARDRLQVLRRGLVAGGYYSGFGPDPTSSGRSRQRKEPDPTDRLVAAGLLLRTDYQVELPREVAVAAWLAEQDLGLSGPPDIPRPDVNETMVRSAAQAAAQEAIRVVTALLDEATAAPLAALKSGGVGARERSRLAKRLSIPADDLALWIDLTYGAGLLTRAASGYVSSADYAGWRAAPPSRQWAALAAAWLASQHAPTSREAEDDREVAPPLPLYSSAGWIRLALLRAAGSGRSVRLAGKEIDWFCPLHGYESDAAADKVNAAVREAELLGVVAVDVLSELGANLLVAPPGIGSETAPETLADLAVRCAPLLPEIASTLIPQSDLTLMVAGQPSAEVSQLLRDAAVVESRGAAGTWRFTPASVRAAMDVGWTASTLLERLAALSARELPQSLEYLINDVARRHGQVRVRGLRSCVVSDEPSTTEILHTRSLSKLHLSRLAPTVLASPLELDAVLAELRRAGFYPVAEDATGTVIVPARAENQAPTSHRSSVLAARRRLTAGELVARLRADPDGASGSDSSVELALAGMNGRLDGAERALLADALEYGRDVVIAYRDNKGSRTVRRIQPVQLFDRWIDSWCHLRGARREFAVANIESVAPAG